ncbi:hypothetical protein ACQEVZ_60680 [Dactylosporangium sp. CA-152071]|uniref:hypothetical protein n=1 Tax=Dactylosporangium sp. CA-152071 TaxID=3239933 RepID=UPI003D8E83A8
MLRFNPRCTKEQADGLRAVVKFERQAERAWWKAERGSLDERDAAERWTATQRARALDALEGRFQAMRAAGELRGAATPVVLAELRPMIEERGWAKYKGKKVPATRRGRPRGTHDETFTDRVTLDLPDDVGQLLVAACHWVSAPILAKLEDWYQQHGDHWRGVRNDPRPHYVGAGPSAADLLTRYELMDQVQTTGRVLRDAIDRAIQTHQREMALEALKNGPLAGG